MTIMQQVLEETLFRKGMNRLGIYQLKRGDELCDYLYTPLEQLQAAGLSVRKEHYHLLYVAEVLPLNTLEGIFQSYNPPHRPDDFFGRSLAISDVIVLNREGNVTAFYVDASKERGHCFVKLPDFIRDGEKPRLLSVVMKGVPNRKDETTPGYILSDGTFLLDDYLDSKRGFYTDGIGRNGILTGFCYYPMIIHKKEVISFSELPMVQEG